jgi:Domain of unknown function (DUF4337)
MSPELDELKESAEHGAHNPSLAPVSLSMAILSVLVAVVGLMGHRSHTEETVLQTKANDQWGYYQAKDIRLHMDKAIADLESFVTVSDPAKAAQAREANLAEAEKYKKQTEELQSEAKDLDRETDLASRRANRYDLGEIFLEVALVITSITLLSGRRIFWHAGLVLGVVGIVVASTALLVR